MSIFSGKTSKLRRTLYCSVKSSVRCSIFDILSPQLASDDILLNNMSREMEQATQVYKSYIDTLRSGGQVGLDPVLFDSPNHIVRHALADILCDRYFDQIPNFRTALEKTLSDESSAIRSRGVSALGEHFSEITDANVLLSRQSKDPDSQVRISVLAAVERNFSEVENAKNLLATLSKDPNPEVRKKVLRVIHEQRDNLDDLLSWITPFTTDVSEDVRSHAGGLLWSAAHVILDPDDIARTFISSDSPGIRSYMVMLVISKIDQINNPHEIVLKGLRDPDPNVRCNALRVLKKRTWKLLPHCLGELNRLCEDEDDNVRNDALWLKNKIVKATGARQLVVDRNS